MHLLKCLICDDEVLGIRVLTCRAPIVQLLYKDVLFKSRVHKRDRDELIELNDLIPMHDVRDNVALANE